MLVWICQLEVNLSEKQTHMFVIKEKKYYIWIAWYNYKQII